MKINLNGDDSKIVKQNETYTLIDNVNLNGLIVSKRLSLVCVNSGCTKHYKHKKEKMLLIFLY